MVSFIRCPVGKMGMVTGIKLAVWFAANLAPFCFGTGGSAAGVGGFINVGCFTVCTVFPVVGLIRCPVRKMGMVIGVRFAIRLAADFALFLCGAGGGAAGVGGFLYICVAS